MVFLENLSMSVSGLGRESPLLCGWPWPALWGCGENTPSQCVFLPRAGTHNSLLWSTSIYLSWFPNCWQDVTVLPQCLPTMIHTYMHIHIYPYSLTQMSSYCYVYASLCIHTYPYVCTYVHVYVCMYVSPHGSALCLENKWQSLGTFCSALPEHSSYESASGAASSQNSPGKWQSEPWFAAVLAWFWTFLSRFQRLRRRARCPCATVFLWGTAFLCLGTLGSTLIYAWDHLEHQITYTNVKTVTHCNETMERMLNCKWDLDQRSELSSSLSAGLGALGGSTILSLYVCVWATGEILSTLTWRL